MMHFEQKGSKPGDQQRGLGCDRPSRTYFNSANSGIDGGAWQQKWLRCNVTITIARTSRTERKLRIGHVTAPPRYGRGSQSLPLTKDLPSRATRISDFLPSRSICAT